MDRLPPNLKSSLILALKAQGSDPHVAGFVHLETFNLPSGVYCNVYYRNNALYIAFRGSDEKKDWFLDINAVPVPYQGKIKTLLAWLRRKKIEKVHLGFRLGYLSVRGFIRTLVGKYSVEKIYLTGHSYGAALATLCAYDLSKRFPSRLIELYLFGSPRVGNDRFCFNLERRLYRSYNFINEDDIVPKLPPKTLGYNTLGMKIKLGEIMGGVSQSSSLDIISDGIEVVTCGKNNHALTTYMELILEANKN